MIMMTLDVKRTHCRNPECPSRICQRPDGYWMCVDCGALILQKQLDSNAPETDEDIPIHVGLPAYMLIAHDEPGREEVKHIKICEVCEQVMHKSMTNLYYYCVNCGTYAANNSKENTTIHAGKGCK